MNGIRQAGFVLAALLAMVCAPQSATALPDRASLPLRAAAPDLVLTGEIGPQDKLTFHDVPFTVPQGVVRISVEFAYTERDKHTVIDLGVSDPDGFRGWSGSNKSSFTLSRTDATPSYLPGAIHAGTWKLNLSVSAIRPDVHSRYTAKVWFWRHGDIPAVSTFSAAPLKNGARWYRGDLHMHTAHSDGSCTSLAGQPVPCPLYRTVEAAVTHGLDFIAMSDHNTGSHYDAMRELQPAFDTLLLIPAVEVTTFQGHANVFGTTEPVDARLGGPTVPNVGAILDQVHDLHALISVNHPTSPTDETCRGCGWSPTDTDWSRVQSVEVLNAGELWGAMGDARVKRPGVAFWRDLLNQGHHLTGVGGSDNHDMELGRLGVGFPTTVVYAPELSERAILDAIKAGHVFIDVRGTRDGLLELTAQAGSGHAIMGDTLALPAGAVAQVSIHVAHAKGGHISLEQDGAPLALADADISGDDAVKTLQVTGDGKPHWIRADVLLGGHPALIGNPIYLAP
ncbi:MAG: CehA/McbA family metallohydrolase [Caulobacteraceae bacterium]